VIETGPRFAGGHAEQMAGVVQVRQHFAHARKQRNRQRVRDIVMTIARGKLAVPFDGEPGRTWRSASARPSPITNLASTSVGSGSPTSRHACCSADAMIAVESASVPSQSKTTKRYRRGLVSGDQPFGIGIETRDIGGELRRERRLDDHLAAIDRMREADRRACRNIRFRPCAASVLFHAKSPYLSSPASGKPRCAR
jgi:hypothetical protein